MNDQITSKLPVWFWIASVIGLLWNGLGVNQYLQQAYQTESFKDMSTPEQLEIYANLPSWYTASFAIAVFAGLIGCILLLLKKKLAYTVLLISLIAVIIQMSYLTFALKMANAMTPLIVIVSLFLVWFAKNSVNKGWLK